MLPHGTCVRKRSGFREPFLTRHLPSPGFLATLSTVCSLSRLVRPVSDEQHLQGFPFGAFSSPRLNRRSCRFLPRLPLLQALLRRAFWTQRSSGLSIDSRVLPRANPSHVHQVFSPTQCWMLPWVSHLSGIVIDLPWSTVSDRPPLTRLVNCMVTRAACSGVSECCRQFDLSDHVGRMSLSGFFHLSIPGVRALIRQPGLCVRLVKPSCVTAR